MIGSPNWVIMSWSSWTRLWQCIMYLPRWFSKRDHADRLVLTAVDDVLGPELVRHRGRDGRRRAAIEDLEVHEVDMDRVEPAAVRVLQLPDLDVLGAGVRRDPACTCCGPRPPRSRR